MRHLFRQGKTVALVAVLALTGCMSIRLDENLADYAESVAEYRQTLAGDEDNFEALRELGAIFVRTQHPAEGYPLLQRAHELRPEDPKTTLYLGLAAESTERSQEALALYARYPEMPLRSSFRRVMQGRYQWLVREVARQEVQARLADEAALANVALEADVVAVFPLAYQGGQEDQFAALGRGLAEMVSIDLTNIERLQVVERARIQVLLDELALGQSGYVDPSTAPRAGRLLGAGQVIGGTFSVLSDNSLRMDAALVNLAGGTPGSEVTSQTGTLDDLFQLQKALVFALLSEMGIELTPAERNQIERIPTQNLQAFLAFSRGLQMEDAGQFEQAASLYEQASQLDPGFNAASGRQESVSSMSATAGSTQDAVRTAAQGAAPTARVNIVSNRVQRLAQSVGASIVGRSSDSGSSTTDGTDDQRQPAAEASNAGVTTLPDPPAVPPRGN